MKLKKIMIAFFSLLAAVFLSVVLWAQISHSVKTNTAVVWVATNTIQANTQIGQNAVQVKIDATAPVRSPQDVSKLYARTDIPKGCIITPELVSRTVEQDVYTHVVVKIDPVPYEALKNTKTIGLLNVTTVNNQTYANAFEDLKLVRVYDQTGREISKVINQQTSNLVSMVEIATDNETAKKIKEKEKAGVYYVLIE